MPFMVIILNMNWLKSIWNLEDGMPSSAMDPLGLIASSICSNGDCYPVIYSPTSMPSRMLACLNTLCQSMGSFAFKQISAPNSLALFSLLSTTSVTITFRAPILLLIMSAIKPMGPAPEISTSSPIKLKVRQVFTALPKGSNSAKCLGWMETSDFQTFS